MNDPLSLFTFVAMSLLVLLVPGPGVAYVVARSVSQGQRAGLLSAFGLSIGVFVHVLATVLGLSAIILASATAFTAVKLLGAAYLLFLGVQAIFARQDPKPVQPNETVRSSRLIAEGVLITALNPKVALFFLAYFPQFIDVSSDAASIASQVLTLGAIYAGLALITDGGYALLAARMRSAFENNNRANRLTQYLVGGTYIGIGLHTAMQSRSAA